MLIADSNEFVREGLVSIFRDSHPEGFVVGLARNGREAIELCDNLRPDVAVIGLSSPDMSDLTVTRHLCFDKGRRVVVLAQHVAAPVVEHVRQAGARALVSKREPASQITAALERVLAGEPFFASELSVRSLSQLQPDEFIPVQFLLTPRELDVLRLLAAGRINKEIAADLNVSVRTVESHHGSIRRRLGTDSLASLVKLALRDGLISPAATKLLRTRVPPLNVAA